FLSEPPISFVVDILGAAFPIIGLVQSITDTVADIAKFVKEFDKTGGMISFGSFDFIDFSDELVSGEMSLSDVDTRDIKMSTTDPSPRPNDFATFGNTDRGISVSLPLLSDPFAALGILMGDFESVDLVTAKFTLFNVDTGVIDIAAEILKEMNAPGWVTDIIESVFKATFELRLKSSFEVGFDLSGLVNFANSYDPERLLDGIFITADPGSILDVYIGAALELNAGIAGLTADVGAGFQLGWNDPNDDGKLRIPELIAIVDAASADPSAIFGYLFEGTASYKLYLAVWAGIPFFTFDITIFDLNGEEKFGDAELPKGIGADLEDDGDTAVLSVGSAAGNSFSENIGKDGDDIITLTGGNSSVKVKLAQGGFNEDGTVNGAGAIIIPAGEGQNVVDMSGLTQDVMTITYTGGNRDEIVLSNQGLHVVFAGDGNDVIKAGSDATGTYVIFADGGEDTIEIEGGNVVVFGDSDFGMRDRLQAAIADRIYKDEKNPITEDFILDILGLNMDGTIKLHLNSDGTIKDDGEISGEYELGGDEILLSTLLTQYTVKTHVTAAGDAENITLGSKSSGNHIVLTGGGADKINVNMSDAGNVKIYSGDGDDVINASGKDLYVEAGGGEDTVTTGGGEDTVTTAVVWGFGAQLGESGISDNAIFNTSGYSDGTDRIIGGGGNDTVYGQLGSDIIEGNSGDDELYGGIGNDFITGGTFNVFVGGTKTNILDIVLDNNKEALTFSTLDEPDGDDKILGGAGNDLLLGGGGSDTVSGGSGGDLVIGDFAEILLSANFVAEGAITQFSDSVNSGRDDLDGGKGGDVLIAGSAREGEREDLKDLFGSNVFLGDFGQVEGANITKSVTIVSSLASATGGDDKVQAGRGNDLIIGGEGADTIASGLGGDIILGDNGIIDIIKSTITGLGLATDGDDVITVGTPNELGGLPATVDLLDVIISGLGDDHINSDVADIVAVLDSGVLTLSVEGLAALRSFVPAVDNASKDDLDVETEALNLILRLVKTAVSTPNANDGDDVLISKNGRVTALLGGGDDTATLQDGETYILGDDGEITLEFGDDGGLAATMASSESLAASNNDIITVRGSGEVAVILGTGNDILYSGAGDDKILGDSGIISLTVDQGGQILASLTSVDGNDTIDSGAGDDAVIAGRGKDRVDTQAGDDWVIGDLGEIVLGNGLTSAKPETLATQNEGFGDADAIDTGADDDVVLAGAGADRVTGGSGEDILVGDDGAIVLASVTGTGTIISSASDTAFGDTLAGGDGNDIIVGGLGDDEILVGEGDDVALGDNAEIIFVNRTDVESIALANLELGGNDTITAAGEAGDNVLFGQFGSDTITGGLNDDLIIGDLGTIEFSSHSNAAVGQSVTDRLMNFTSIEDPFIDDLSLLAPYGLLSALEAGDDLIFGGAGADMIVAGFGDDSVSGGDGQDVLVGDSAILTRSFDTLNGVTVEKFTLDTNYAFETGGFDELNGNDGPDILIGNLGPDRFFGNTQTDLIFSDGYAGIFTAEFPENGYMGDTPQRFLLTSNFAGAGAIDVVSRAQQDDSVGAPLSTMEEFGKSILVNANELLDRSNFLDSAADDPSDLADLLSFLNSHVFIDTLTQLKLLEFDTVDILQVLNDMVAQLFKGDGTASAAEREYLLNLLIQAVLKQLDLTSEQDEMNQQEAEDAA
ncbi:MAG: Ca2+-binding RTX toxin-like protein, partial [Candidatus Azotimanducaceae bacterium]